MSRHYYKFWQSSGDGRHYFRKNYFMRRLEFVRDHVGSKTNTVLDVGCGFGTTDIFLALNGYRVHGITIESQFSDRLAPRLAYWSRFGDISGFTWAHENLLESDIGQATVDRIIVQDTLHHLEPIGAALAKLKHALKPGGSVIAIEENGNNIVQRLLLLKRRGTRRVVEIHDETLGKTILMGNENIRSLNTWRGLCVESGLSIAEWEYIRLLPGLLWSSGNYERLQQHEKELYKRNEYLREYCYFGINFTIVHAGTADGRGENQLATSEQNTPVSLIGERK